MQTQVSRSRTRAAAWAVAALCSPLVAASAIAQGAAGASPAPATRGAPAAAPDSATLVEGARDAQSAFERRRRALLPVSHGGLGRCDVQIGRWCYWYDEQEPAVPREPEAIARARDRLVTVLRDASTHVPEDPWVVGQQVRYLVEAGRMAEAASAARSCTADGSWCSALLGFALHRSGDAVGAERAFDDALRAMPADSACRWLDPRPIVPADARDALGDACAPGDSLTARFWHLATPFLVRGANDRRNEHLARRVLSRLFASSRTPYADRWSDDLDELLVRYGWPDRWSRRETPPHATGPIDAVGHEPWPSYRFTPDVAALFDARAAAPSVRDRDAHERAAPLVARRVAELTLSAAAFRRGDSLRVVAAAVPPPDSVRTAYDSIALVVAPLHHSASAARVPLASGSLVGTATAPAVRALVGMEAVGDSAYALRGRTSVVPPRTDGGFGVSDLLLFTADARSTIPGSLDEALPRALPAAVRSGDAIGVFWELYGLGDGAHAVETALFVETPPPGWLARMLGRLRGDAPAVPPRLRWTDVGAGGTVAPRAVRLDAAFLARGQHELVLEVRHRDGRTATARRTIVVR